MNTILMNKVFYRKMFQAIAVAVTKESRTPESLTSIQIGR